MAASPYVDHQNNQSQVSAASLTLPVEDFIIGDRVLVGDKSGVIAFIGDVKFANGEFAGVVLDEPCGKNDGSVKGTRYFQCDANRGVFVRMSKLVRNSSFSASPLPRSARCESVTPRERRASGGSVGQPSTRKALGSSGSPMNGVGKATPSPRSSNLKVGERVLVNGNKAGVLRFLGSTDFAQGEWAGVELDEAVGKNNGTVNGVRYFECLDKHGLFAPSHKVSRSVSSTSSGSPSPSIASAGRASPRFNNVTAQRKRSPSLNKFRHASQESLTSHGSGASQHTSKSRDGNSNGKRKTTPTTTDSSMSTDALQKALREKEEHIEQLLKERELERSEVSRSNSRLDETEEKLAQIQDEYESLLKSTQEKIKEFQDHVTRLENEKKELSVLLDEQKTKIEDLQFQLEEEAICKADMLDESNNKDSELVMEKQRELEEERQHKSALEKEMAVLKDELAKAKASAVESEDTAIHYLDQIEELTHKLSTAEKQVISNVIPGTSPKADLNEQLALQIKEIEKLRSENSKLNITVLDLKQRLEQSDKCAEEALNELEMRKSSQDFLEEELSQLRAEFNLNNNLADEIDKVKQQLTDAEAMLATSQTEKDQVKQDKKKMEEQLAHLQAAQAEQEQLTNQQTTQLKDELKITQRNLEDSQLSCSDLSLKLSSMETMLSTLQTQHKQNLTDLQEDNNKHIETLKTEQEKALERNKMENKIQIEQLLHQIHLLEQQKLHPQKTLGEKTILNRTLPSTPCDNCSSLQVQIDKLKQLRLEDDSSKKLQMDESVNTIKKLKTQIMTLTQDKIKLESALQAKSQMTELLKLQVSETQEKLTEWQQEVQAQIDNNKLLSEKDLESLRQELVSSQSLLVQLEKKLNLSEEQKIKLQHRVNSLSSDLKQAQQALYIPRAGSTYRDTSDVLFNQLKRQVEVMEVSLEKAKDDCQIVREENDHMRLEISVLKQELTKSIKREEVTKSTLKKENSLLKQKLSSHTSMIQNGLQINGLAISKPDDSSLVAQLRKALAESESARLAQQHYIDDLSYKTNELHSCLNLYHQADNSPSPRKAAVNGDGESKLSSPRVSVHSRYLKEQWRRLHHKYRHSSSSNFYCDICDISDQHATEDCPIQETHSLSSHSQNSSIYAINNNNVSMWCNVCQNNSHWTADCTVGEDE